MVEVFKTNVNTQSQADLLTAHLQLKFEGYQINFDLDDCDNILRVASDSGKILSAPIIGLLDELGFTAEVLADVIPEQHSTA